MPDDGEYHTAVLDKILAGVAADGAAADGAEGNDPIASLPRVVRYAVMGLKINVRARVAADAAVITPSLANELHGWLETDGAQLWLPLASALDGLAVKRDLPVARALADIVRMSSMSVKDVMEHPTDAFRVAASIRAASDHGIRSGIGTDEVHAVVDKLVIGWTWLAAGGITELWWLDRAAHAAALDIGTTNSKHVVRQAVKEVEARQEARTAEKVTLVASVKAPGLTAPVPPGYKLVFPAVAISAKMRDIIHGHDHVIGKNLPLVPVRDLSSVHQALLTEFPFATDFITSLLSPLVARQHLRFPPTLVIGRPGCGKSRLLRRVSELLGIVPWRTDGAQADGNLFGGTDRRWWSAEPAHPFLAVSRARVANPLVLIDELDKTATRTDQGRLWDSLLPFLEEETAGHYPDPALQVTLDLSQVSYIAVANGIGPIPQALIDRFRVVEMPDPRASDLPILVSSLLIEHAREAGLDRRWHTPLNALELEMIAARWRGGSVRRLRRFVGTILRARDRTPTTLQ